MQYLVSAAALAAAVTSVYAVPHELVDRSKHAFTVPQVAAGTYFKNGPIHMEKTYAKYAVVGASAPADVVSAAAAAKQSGAVTASPEQYDQAYLCQVTAGSSKLSLDFDTGSSDLWTFSTVTPKSESAGHDLYNPSTSGKKKSGYTWNISYGDGSGASGVVYSDKVVVGSVTATSQAVEAATSVSSEFEQDPADGLLGLAFSSINTVKPQAQTTFFDTVSSTLASKLFAADLKHNAAGAYDFGFVDMSRYNGSITYVPVDNSQGFWGFTAGNSIGSSIADTGTTLLYLPDSVVNAYYANTGATYDSTQGGYTFPCSTTLPNYKVTIGGTVFTVPGSYINYAPVDSTGTTCFGGIQSNSGIGLTIFGDIFLKSVYAIFDQSTGSPRLGFATKKLT